MAKFWFDVVTCSGTEKMGAEIDHLYVAGFAGRDIEKTKAHIEELAELGVARPRNIPEYYCNTKNCLTQDEVVQVAAPGSSGEVEFVLIPRGGEIYVGIGSDHTDRDLEAVDVTKAKQACPKPIGKTLWRYSEIKDHWDELVMESWQDFGDGKVLYQKGTAADLLPVETLMAGAREHVTEKLGDALIFTGTVAAIGGIRGGKKFWGKITDEKLNRSLEFEYDVEVLGQ